MNGPASARWPFRPGANRPRARAMAAARPERAAPNPDQRLARHAARVRSRRALLASVGKALLLTLLAALAAAPLAVGLGNQSRASGGLPRAASGEVRQQLPR